MPKLLHEIFADILSAMSFVVSFDSVTNNGDGTYTLNKVCGFHHIQPAEAGSLSLYVTINGNTYTVDDYDYTARTITVRGVNAIGVNSFNLYKPFLFHGTPMQQNSELIGVPLPAKTPMIYLMEPYKIENDYTPSSSIDRACTFTLCFLTQANTPKWKTDDFYHNAIHPMNNMMEDFIGALNGSNLFYSVEQKTSPKFYTKFGINISQTGTKELLLSENLSGVGVDLKLEIYADADCDECLSGSFSNGFSNGFLI